MCRSWFFINFLPHHFQTSVTIEIRYQPMDGTVGVWSDGEFLDVPDDRDGMFAFETDSLLSGQSHGSGTSPGRSLQGSIPTFRKWVQYANHPYGNMITIHYSEAGCEMLFWIWILIWSTHRKPFFCCLIMYFSFEECWETCGWENNLNWWRLTDGCSIHTTLMKPHGV